VSLVKPWGLLGRPRPGRTPAKAKEEVDEIRSTALAALALAATTFLSAAPAQAHVAACDGRPAPILCAVHHWRDAVWRLEAQLGMPATRYGWSAERSTSGSYRVWVRHRWHTRYVVWRHRLRALLPPGIVAGLMCIHPNESVDWHLNGGMGPQVSGGLQIALTTWQANGGLTYAPAAYLATPTQQLIVGVNIVESSGFGPWPVSAATCGLI
jgi:hypothetical protein